MILHFRGEYKNIMKITTLIENLVYRPDLVSEHGLSLYIDTGRRRIIFDAGQSDAFLLNSRILDIDITKADAMVISHGHYDHTGGLVTFLRQNKHAPVYLKQHALDKKYNNTMKLIGTSAFPAKYLHRLHFVDEVTEIDDGVFIMPRISVINSDDTSFSHFYTDKGEGIVNDEFHDELFLAIIDGGKLSVLSSCSHRGISNILAEGQKMFDLPLHLVAGGFHLRGASQEQIDSVFSYISNVNPDKIGICHCTGVNLYASMAERFGNKVFYNYTGNVIKI